MVHLFHDFPEPDQLVVPNRQGASFEVNAHVHSPYSFSAFASMDALFVQAAYEGIEILGINDFNTANGFQEFTMKALEYDIFPLFGMEFMGLLREEQEKGERINDPSNPGRTYLCGKGFQDDFYFSGRIKSRMDKLIDAGHGQLKEMVDRLNKNFAEMEIPLNLSFDTIRDGFARDLVRERHVARAIKERLRTLSQHSTAASDLLGALLTAGSDSGGPDNDVLLENSIRSRFLKKGGPGYVEETESSFLPVPELVDMIRMCGGIPCYPVLLDNENGQMTEFESDWKYLSGRLKKLGIYAVELIPPRNDIAVMRSFVEFFDREGFVITYGTEHNTPYKASLRIGCRGGVDLDPGLKKIGLRGAQVIAAHQYLVSKDRYGFSSESGTIKNLQKNDLESLGHNVLKWYFRHRV